MSSSSQNNYLMINRICCTIPTNNSIHKEKRQYGALSNDKDRISYLDEVVKRNTTLGYKKMIIFVFLFVLFLFLINDKPCNVDTGFMCYGYDRIIGRTSNVRVIESTCDACAHGHIDKGHMGKNPVYKCDDKIKYPCFNTMVDIVDNDKGTCVYDIGTYSHKEKAYENMAKYTENIRFKVLKPFHKSKCIEPYANFTIWQFDLILLFGLFLTTFFLLHKIFVVYNDMRYSIYYEQVKYLVNKKELSRLFREDRWSMRNGKISIHEEYEPINDEDDSSTSSMKVFPERRTPIASPVSSTTQPSAPPTNTTLFSFSIGDSVPVADVHIV